MSTRSPLESAKASGDYIEADIIQTVDALEYVGDTTATWYDARTTTLLEPSSSLTFYGIVVVETETPVEIKACQIETGNGGRSTRGRDYSRSKRSSVMTLSHAATKSCTNFSSASSEP